MPRFWIRIPHRFNRMYRTNSKDVAKCDVKDSRLCIIGFIMVIYGIVVLLFIIPKAYLIKNYSYNDGTTLSESNIAKPNGKYNKLEFEKSGSQAEMSTIKLEDGVEKGKPRQDIPKDKNNAFWSQDVNNIVQIKYIRKKIKRLFKKPYIKNQRNKLSAEKIYSDIF